VHVFEKYAKAGGLLRYGIPDFKMEKHVIDRRVTQMEAEGVTFHYGTPVGGTGQGAIDPREMQNHYDVLALTGGSEAPRDLLIPGRDLGGIHFAMDFLPQQYRRVSSEPLGSAAEILAGGKHVVVIGGGDTGSDCIGTSFRQGALSVTQLEIMAAPPEHEDKGLTWPNWPLKMRTSSSQAEGARRDFAVLTQKFSGDDGKVAKLHCVQVDDKFKPIAGSEYEIEAQLVLLAMGFVHPVHEGLLKTLGVDLDQRGNVRANLTDYQTSRPNVFSAGDMRRGQSLVVWAIREGRLCARAIDQHLMGTTNLPR
jgi:glutamate synthase (NADPH/NADH) small chain